MLGLVGPEELDVRRFVGNGRDRSLGAEGVVRTVVQVEKQGVGEVDHPRDAPKIPGQGELPTVVEPFAEGREDRRLGPPEAVDRLLRIADEEQAARTGIITRQRPDDRPLDRIGILEFVDEQEVDLLPERANQLVPVVSQQSPGPDEQVVEVNQLPATLQAVDFRQRLPRQRGEPHPQLGRSPGQVFINRQRGPGPIDRLPQILIESLDEIVDRHPFGLVP